MNRTRHEVALVIVVALAAFTALALRPPEQAVVALPATTTTTAEVVTTTTLPPTTTTTVVDRHTEVEGIVAELYFHWFDGLYRRDLETIDRVAGVNRIFEWAEEAFDRVVFTEAPTRQALGVDLKRILLDRPDCLVVSAAIDFRSFVDVENVMDTVDVLFPVGDHWGFAKFYKYEREMWQADCDHLQRR